MADLGKLASGERLLKLYFPDNDGPDVGLLVNRLEALESVSCDFRYEVTVLSDTATLDLNGLIGKAVCVELLRDRLPSRYFHGHCFSAQRLRVESDLAVYRLVLSPWLHMFRVKRNYRLFHYQSIADQSKVVFCETGLSRHTFRIHESDPSHTYACQYDETDHNYLHRRWEEIGWHYFYEHTEGGHTLVLADTSPAAQAVDGSPTLVWRHDDDSPDPYKITVWRTARRLVPAALTQTGFDFKGPSVGTSRARNDVDQGNIHQWEVHQYLGFKTRAHAECELEAVDVKRNEVSAHSGCRNVQPGRYFRLQVEGSECADHGKLYFITTVRHVADNNFLNADGRAAHYENEFECVPLEHPWRPAPGRSSMPVFVDGVDTATVTGPAGQEVFPDEYGRLRVQFHWDREGQFDAKSSAWLRVAGRRSGGEFGTVALARVGQEVLVQYLAGNPDRPIITGSVYNARNKSPWLLSAQQALSGIRSRELAPGGANAAGGRSNHLIFDDSADQIQVQLKSDHCHSQLSLGWITRIDDHSGRKDGRGQGFECRTDGWGALRAGKGMVISTTLRPNLAKHAKDIPDAVNRLERAVALAREQTVATHQAAAQRATDPTDAKQPTQQAEVVALLHEQVDACAGRHEQQTGRPEELRAPHLLAESPAGIAVVAEQSISAEAPHLAQTAGKHLAWVAGGSLWVTADKMVRAWVKRAGIKLMAAAGDVDVQAMSKVIHLFAKGAIHHHAGTIEIRAKEEVVINGGGSYMTLSAGRIERGTTGAHNSHAAKHSLISPKQMGPGKFIDTRIEPRKPLAVPPKFNMVLTHLPGPQGIALPNLAWRIVKAVDAVAALRQGAALFKGKSDRRGKVILTAADEAALLVEWNRQPYHLWLVYANQVRNLVLSREDPQWDEQEKLEHALDGMGFSDNLWQSAEGDPVESGRLRQAHHAIGTSDAAGLFEQFKKDGI